MRNFALTFVIASALYGCGSSEPAGGDVTKGTLGLQNLTPEEQIKKVEDDKSIPEEYKKTYINSIKAKAGK